MKTIVRIFLRHDFTFLKSNWKFLRKWFAKRGISDRISTVQPKTESMKEYVEKFITLMLALKEKFQIISLVGIYFQLFQHLYHHFLTLQKVHINSIRFSFIHFHKSFIPIILSNQWALDSKLNWSWKLHFNLNFGWRTWNHHSCFHRLIPSKQSLHMELFIAILQAEANVSKIRLQLYGSISEHFLKPILILCSWTQICTLTWSWITDL